ncbi:hypothetical protein [Aggregatilinea lenta]|uniref:hypothetical protein n=1 Tax=Aggregatilinea lenta TaxID=913108 RepID=UPI000E5B3E70|nr:hypothetical protein [Aggregatilinea lenta]
MSTWVIPYIDQPVAFWQDLHAQFGPFIEEVYFPIPGEGLGTGRAPQPHALTEAFLRDAPFHKSVLVNPIVLPLPVDRIGPLICDVLSELYADYGIQRVVVSNLTLAHMVRERLPHYRITASVLMGIATPAQALMVRDAVDVIVPDTRLIRDLRRLQCLRAAFTGELRLIVNEACLGGCPYRTQHFFEMGYGDWFPESLCGPLLDAQPWLRLTGAWILPQHLKIYEGLYDSLKLAGRVTLRDPKDYVRVLDAYIHNRFALPSEIGGGPASVLDAITVSDEWFEYTLTCDKNCSTCPVCKTYFERSFT